MKKNFFYTTLAVLLAVTPVKIFAAEDQPQDFSMNAHVKQKFIFDFWVKEMHGTEDPGKSGNDIGKETNLNFTTFWDKTAGRFRSENGKWYAIFFALDSNLEDGFHVSVSAEPIRYSGNDDDNVSASVIVVPDLSLLDVWGPGNDKTYGTSDDIKQMPLKPTEYFKSPGADNSNYVECARSVAAIIDQEGNNYEVYSVHDPVSRISRCYISIFDYQDPSVQNSVSFDDMNDAKIGGKPLKNAGQGTYTGTITFTMVPN